MDPVLIRAGRPGAGKSLQTGRPEADFGPDQPSAGSVPRAPMAAGTNAGHFARATCSENDFNEFKQPAMAGICDTCDGTAFTRRADDYAGTVRAGHTDPARLTAHHDRLSILMRIPAMGSIDGMRIRMDGIVGRVSA